MAPELPTNVCFGERPGRHAVRRVLGTEVHDLIKLLQQLSPLLVYVIDEDRMIFGLLVPGKATLLLVGFLAYAGTLRPGLPMIVMLARQPVPDSRARRVGPEWGDTAVMVPFRTPGRSDDSDTRRATAVTGATLALVIPNPRYVQNERVLSARVVEPVVRSCRGTYGSGGRFKPLLHERPDGMDTVDWLRRRRWYGGSFGIFGASYQGFVQWALAADAGLEPVPRPVRPPDSFRYDPADPTDVLTYTSAALHAPVDVRGPVTAQVYVHSTLPYFDVFVRLCDVDRRGGRATSATAWRGWRRSGSRPTGRDATGRRSGGVP